MYVTDVMLNAIKYMYETYKSNFSSYISSVIQLLISLMFNRQFRLFLQRHLIYPWRMKEGSRW